MSIPPRALADPSFHLMLCAAAANRELVAEFDRLTGSNLLRRGSLIELAVDDATGRSNDEVAAFVGFVLDIYDRMPKQKPGGAFRRSPAHPSRGLTYRPFGALLKKGTEKP